MVMMILWVLFLVGSGSLVIGWVGVIGVIGMFGVGVVGMFGVRLVFWL